MAWTPLWEHTNAKGQEEESGRIMLHQLLKKDFLFLKEGFFSSFFSSKSSLSLILFLLENIPIMFCFFVS